MMMMMMMMMMTMGMFGCRPRVYAIGIGHCLEAPAMHLLGPVYKLMLSKRVV